MAEIFKKERTNTTNPSATTVAAAAPPEDEMAIFLHYILSSSSSSSHSSISPIKQMPSSSSSYIPQSGWEIFRHGKAIQSSALPPPALLLPSDSVYNRRKPLPIDSNRWNGTSADDSSAGLESSALIFSGERSVSSPANFPVDSEKKEGQCVTDSGTICSIGSFLDRQDSLCLPSSGGSLGSPVKDSVSGKRRKPPDSDWDDFDCESEEGQEALEEMSKSVPSRTSLKRSRAAEVHNLSEKRRRSRINEKMKALQNLIPNSNKTDKASMLDEAIEYLKHLQLQVQMLSMRNGLNLSTMYMPGGLQSIQMPQMHMGFGIGNSLPPNVNLGTGMGMLPVNQGPSTHPPFSLSSECTPSMVVPNLPTVTSSENPFGMNTSLAHLRPTYQLPNTAEEIYRTGSSILPQQKFDVVQSGRSHLSENKTKPVVPLDGQAAMMEAGDCLEACTILRGENLRQMLAGNVDTRVLIQHLHDLKTVARVPDNRIEEGARDF